MIGINVLFLLQCMLGIALAAQPNLLFILVDDQDVRMGSIEYMPKLQKHLVQKGTTYTSHYCTTSICCPSRVSMWTGKLAHNTNVTDLTGPYGGYPKFVAEGWNDDWFPVWAQKEGYNTYYSGKLMNSHTRYNYDKPYPKGFTGTRFYITPWTYWYLLPAIQKNREPPKVYAGTYSNDLITDVTLELIDEAVAAKKPWVVVAAPIGPHASADENTDLDQPAKGAPIPAERHRGLFKGSKIPRSDNFNPKVRSGGNWVEDLPRLTPDQVDILDYWHETRLETMLSIDDMVEAFVKDLDRRGILDDTYIIYTSDNGFHLGQHRLPPGKGCGYEEDINVPLVIRGPNVPQDRVVDFPTTHIDMVPTMLQMLDMSQDHNLDGAPIPITKAAIDRAETSNTRQEHVTVEYWGRPNKGGNFSYPELNGKISTYKGVRVVAREYSFYYQIWCDNTKELYDVKADPGQMTNLLETGPQPLLGRPKTQVVNRLDALLLVLKTCRGGSCIRPWQTMMPNAGVTSLRDALAPRYDNYFERQAKVNYNKCELGYIQSSETPLWQRDGRVWLGSA